jgi:cobalt-zinc-cadmium efflux system protein
VAIDEASILRIIASMAHTHAVSHNPIGSASRRLTLALVITLAFVGIEAAAGYLANSLALLTDAAHNFTDVIALALSWYALRLTLRPAHSGKTFGYHRAGILIALLNSTTLVLIAIGIFAEAYHRFNAPPQVQAGVLIGVGSIAVVVNVVTAWLVHQGSDHDLNLRSAFVHLMGDVLSTVGAVLAGVGIALTGWQILDPLVSVLIGVLILWNAWRIIRESVGILLESTPRDVNLDAMVDDLLTIDGVRGVHDLHVWSITQDLRSLSAHVLTDDVSVSAGAIIQERINFMLHDKYSIHHSALQLECANCQPDQLFCDLNDHKHSVIHDA